jgi:hypothetical protein
MKKTKKIKMNEFENRIKYNLNDITARNNKK